GSPDHTAGSPAGNVREVIDGQEIFHLVPEVADLRSLASSQQSVRPWRGRRREFAASCPWGSPWLKSSFRLKCGPLGGISVATSGACPWVNAMFWTELEFPSPNPGQRRRRPASYHAGACGSGGQVRLLPEVFQAQLPGRGRRGGTDLRRDEDSAPNAPSAAF